MLVEEIKNLSENSKSYYSENNIYDIFSSAEDYQDLIWKNIHFYFEGKNVLDLGCGNGKYLKKIAFTTKNYVGIDKSANQLLLQDLYYRKHTICADATQIPIADNSMDVVFSSWMLGTILDDNKKEKVLKEINRVLKVNGIIIFIENDINSEFENMRGRNTLLNSKTQDYNMFLENNGFNVYKRIDTFFQFENLEKAKETFRSIWGKNLLNLPNSNKIEHKVIIFKSKKIDK